jgi:hypothetical protein
MTSELLDRVHAEIRERRDERRSAVEEYERLEAALAALEAVRGGGDAPRQAAPERPAAEPRAPRPRRAKPARAARGANREAVLKAAADQPGATAGELAAASGVGRPVVYNLVKTLTDRGELVKRGTGYALASTPEPVAAAPAPEPEAPKPEAAKPEPEPALAVPAPEPEPPAQTPEPAEPIKSEPPRIPTFGLPRTEE